MHAALLDLMLGSRCVVCARPGRGCCEPCRAVLASIDPVRRGLGDGVVVWSAVPYEGPIRDAIVAHKERGAWALTPLLGPLLAQAVRASASGRRATSVLLVPVPSRPGSVRRRGHDPLGAIAHSAARAEGARVATLLRSRGGVRDQTELNARERAANVAGSMWVDGHVLARQAMRARDERLRVVLVDDVVTTGATLLESLRALQAVGVRVASIATVASTPLGPGETSGGIGRRHLGPTLGSVDALG